MVMWPLVLVSLLIGTAGGALAADGWTQADLIWRHGQTGDVAVWLMDGVSVKQAPLVWLGVASAWQISGVEDVDGDGNADLVWRNEQSADVAVWLMNGVTVRQSSTSIIGNAVPLGWRFQ